MLVALCACFSSTIVRSAEPVRFAIVGLVHDHARGFIPSTKSRLDVQLVAIVEPNQELAQRYAQTYRLDTNLFYTSLDEMLEKTKVQAVATFTSTFDHTKVVETCATRGVHVEKPLVRAWEKIWGKPI
jgi:predicted dehydrogenase